MDFNISKSQLRHRGFAQYLASNITAIPHHSMAIGLLGIPSTSSAPPLNFPTMSKVFLVGIWKNPDSSFCVDISLLQGS